MDTFFQKPPVLANQFTSDTLLKQYLQWKLPQNIYTEIEPGLIDFGNRVTKEILLLGREAEKNIPLHVPYNPWGKRIDKIEVSTAWDTLKKISAQENLVTTAYQKKQYQYSRLYQFAKLYLFHASSAFYTCPLAMTDGAARVIELYGDVDLKQNYFSRLTSNNPDTFWTSGQWMTERTGGSDIAGTQTKAIWENDQYTLHGTKWFTSATTSEMALTLAEIEDSESTTKTLSLFLVKLRDDNDCLQNIFVHRLKDKLGTKALPTAELSLQGTPAILVGEKGKGVRQIASMLNITRLYNSITALSDMRRCFVLALDYSKKRKAFGKYLIEHPLHLQTLSELSMSCTTCFHLVFYLAEVLGKSETNTATPEEEKVLRILTPIAKLYTAKQAIAVASETLECFGGVGYIEDTHLPQFLRNAQVYSIWEGTTNILSLDVLRSIAKENTYASLEKISLDKIKNIKSAQVTLYVIKVKKCFHNLSEYLSKMESNSENMESGAREFAYSIAKVFIGVLLLEYYEHNQKADPVSFYILERWFSQDFLSITYPGNNYHKATKGIVFGGTK